MDVTLIQIKKNPINTRTQYIEVERWQFGYQRWLREYKRS